MSSIVYPPTMPKNVQRIQMMREAQAFVKYFAKKSFEATGDERWKDYPNVDKFDHLHEELIEMSRKLRYKSKKTKETDN